MGISCKAVAVMPEVVSADSGQWRDSGMIGKDGHESLEKEERAVGTVA